MEWGFAGMCGTLWPGWWRGPHGPGPGPGPWLLIAAGIIGGIGAVAIFGEALAPDGGLLATAVISIVGGNFLALVTDAVLSGMNRANVARTGV